MRRFQVWLWFLEGNKGRRGPLESTPFVVSRCIFEKPIWQNVLQFRLFFYLFGHAVFAPQGVQVGEVLVQRGQVLRSYRKLREDLTYIENNAVRTYSLSQIKKAVDRLELDGRVSVACTKLGTLFTLINYEQYQALSNYKGKGLRTGLRTGLEQGSNNNINVTNVTNVTKDKRSSSKPFADGSLEMILAGQLKNKILGNNETAKTPSDLNKWAEEFDKMLRLDKRKFEDIERVIEFCQTDPFWIPNILSAKKLREKYDTLYLQSKNQKGGKPNGADRENPEADWESKFYSTPIATRT